MATLRSGPTGRREQLGVERGDRRQEFVGSEKRHGSAHRAESSDDRSIEPWTLRDRAVGSALASVLPRFAGGGRLPR